MTDVEQPAVRSGRGGVALPAGFVAHVGSAGLRAGGDHDVAVVCSTVPCSSAGVFTRSRFAGPSVTLSRPLVAAGTARGFVVVASNANVATGDQGRRDAGELGRLAARACGVGPAEMLVASTGVIGRPYPMALLRAHLGELPAALSAGAGADSSAAPRPGADLASEPGASAGADRPVSTPWRADALDVARAIMTTDLVAKTAVREIGAVRVVGVAKGVGMIEPDMATMLCFVLTDAAVAPAVLDRIWRRAVDDTFNCLSVDTDTSTSDTAAVLANGAAGPLPEGALAAALREVCLDLTLQLARDGEGATKLLTVTVRSARDRDQARRVAKAIVNSPLVKTAVHGADPNWGRVAMAIGKCSDDHDIDQDWVVIRFGDLEAYPAIPGRDGLAALAGVMAADHVDIEVELHTGDAETTVYGCDLSAGYVRINADYTT